MSLQIVAHNVRITCFVLSGAEGSKVLDHRILLLVLVQGSD